MNPSPPAAAILPGARSVEIAPTAASATATVFATLLDNSATDRANCGIMSLINQPVGTFVTNYQTTNPATNAVTGEFNTPVPIAVHGAQTVLVLSSSTTAVSASGPEPVFVSASGAVPFAPAASRIFVRFLDVDGSSHGSTSVAVTTD